MTKNNTTTASRLLHMSDQKDKALKLKVYETIKLWGARYHHFTDINTQWTKNSVRVFNYCLAGMGIKTVFACWLNHFSLTSQWNITLAHVTVSVWIRHLFVWAPELHWADSGRWYWGYRAVSGCAVAAAWSEGLWSWMSCQTAVHLGNKHTHTRGDIQHKCIYWNKQHRNGRKQKKCISLSTSISFPW